MIKRTSKKNHLSLGKKKPSVLYVYLVLETEARTKPMGRDAIIASVKKRFGVSLSKKTISEAADIFKSLSCGKHPLMDFHQKGKKGYVLGRMDGPLSEGEVLRLLECFSDISPAAADKAFSSLRPLMKTRDANRVEEIRHASLLLRPEEQSSDKDYFARIKIIAEAISRKKDLYFDHHYLEDKNQEIRREENVCLAPYYLFSKRGRYYLLGGRPGGWKLPNGDSLPCFYIADIAHMENVRIAEDAILNYEKCLYGKRLDFASYLSHVGFIREGNFHFSSNRGFPAEVYREEGLLMTEMMYGNCFDLISKENTKAGDHYHILLKLDLDSLISWGLYFAGRKLGRLSLEERQSGYGLGRLFRKCGSLISEAYQIDPKKFNKIKDSYPVASI
jgi:hypothetical protein